MVTVDKCTHVYSSVCTKCKEDTTFKWITCSEYKVSCPPYVCTECGEIETAPAPNSRGGGRQDKEKT